MPLNSVVAVETDQRVATVTLDRPSSGNMVDERMAFELRDACRRLDADDDVWVVIVTGSGDAFCRGSELPGAADRSEGRLADSLGLLRVSDSVAAIEKPVIGAVNGDAIDQGLEVALACDIRIASSAGRFGLTHVEEGLVPWDGGTQRLPRVVGRSRAMLMILTSRVVEAEEALNIGLMSRLVEPRALLSEARALADAIAGHGPIAARYLKEAVLKGMEMTLEQGLRLEADLNFLLHGTADRDEGIRSFLERRRPEYQGR